MNRKFHFLISIFFFAWNANAQWTLVNTGLCNPGVFSFAVIDSSICVGTNIGVCLSSDNGNAWAPATSSAPVLALVTDGANIFAGTEGNGVFLSTDKGVTWSAVNSGLTNLQIFSLAINGDHTFAGTEGGGVFLSTDNGNTWNEVNSGLTNPDIRAFAINGSTIFAGTNGGGIFESVNNGTTWTAINTGLPAGAWVRGLEFSGASIFAATDNGVYRSTNNGSNWTAINTGLMNTNVFSLAVSGSTIFAGTDGGGVFSSTDNGNTWTSINDGFPATPGISFSLEITATNIFVAMYSEGVYTRPLDEITGIRETFSDPVISVFPNPSGSEFCIQADISQPVQFTLYNSIGKKITEKILTAKKSNIDLSAYPSDIYYYKLNCSVQQLKSGKIIKQ